MSLYMKKNHYLLFCQFSQLQVLLVVTLHLFLFFLALGLSFNTLFIFLFGLKKKVHFFLTFVSILTEAAMTSVKMQPTLEVHQIDPTKDQEDSTREEAESWDVVPQCNSDTLEQTLKQTLLQVALIQIIMCIHLRKN